MLNVSEGGGRKEEMNVCEKVCVISSGASLEEVEHVRVYMYTAVYTCNMLDLGLFKLDHVSSPDQHADTGTAARTAPAIQEVVAAIYGRQIKH